ncbi:MAG: hypothetical protein H6717_10915 [Polyangiaceae bacterium]|nr:hypothetical protein [Polyangiaceae bacterium]
MRLSSTLAVAITLLASLSGCRSAHIKDLYVSRDADGVRRTKCIHPDASGFYVTAEVLSYRDDTLLWPYVTVLGGNDEPDTTLPFVLAQDGQPFYDPDSEHGDELNEFGNIATGKGESQITISHERDLEADPPDPRFSQGSYRIDYYLNDENSPRDGIAFVVNNECPYSPLPDTL